MLEQASEWLNSQRVESLSTPVVYLRRGGERLTVNATLGRTLFRAENEYGITIRVESRDFLVSASELVNDPERGDQIIFNGTVFEVLAPNSEPVWRWSGSFHTTRRIHTKEIGGA